MRTVNKTNALLRVIPGTLKQPKRILFVSGAGVDALDSAAAPLFRELQGIEILLLLATKSQQCDLTAIAEKACQELADGGFLEDSSIPLTVMGFSFGSSIALDICILLEKEYGFSVHQFIPVACPAPHSFPFHLKRILRSKAGRRYIMKYLIKSSGESFQKSQATTLLSKDNINLFLVFAEHAMAHKPPLKPLLTCPIISFQAYDDLFSVVANWYRPLTRPHRLENEWARYTTSKTDLIILEGGHFFPFDIRKCHCFLSKLSLYI